MQGSQAACALNDGVVGGLVAVAAVLAKAVEAAVNDLRVDLADVFIRQPKPRHRRRAHVPDHDIGFFQQTVQCLHAGGLFQIEHDRTLVAVQMQELRAHAGGGRLAVHETDQVAGLVFNLDDFRAVISEDLRAQRADHHRGEVDHAHTFERASGHYANSAVAVSDSAP